LADPRPGVVLDSMAGPRSIAVAVANAKLF
jgi:hypothetical protein